MLDAHLDREIRSVATNDPSVESANPTIGVMGYYGFGNLGDEMLLDALRRFLAPHRVIAFPTAFNPTADALDRLNSYDYLILGGGGLFNRTPAAPFDTFHRWASQLRTPISVLGLGVEKLDDRYLPAVHGLVEQADFFVVRDVESQKLIRHPKVQVAPDLTFYQPLPLARFSEEGQEPLCGVNLRPLHQGVDAWVDAIRLLPCRKLALPFSLVPTYDDREPISQIVSPCFSQASAADYEHLDLVIGAAFHSIVLAIQAGVPAIAINYHPKVRRLMEEIGLADYVLEWEESQKLRPCFERALAERELIRGRMLAYRNHAQLALTSTLREVRSVMEMRISACKTNRHSVGAQRRVTVFVLCQGASEKDVALTLASCWKQTYQRLKVVLVNCPKAFYTVQNAPDDSKTLSHITTAGAVSWNDLSGHCAEYVTWVTAGCWYADDAVALLVQALDRQPAASVAFSDYYITSNGIIDRKIKLSAVPPGNILPIGSCFLVRREFSESLWRADRSGTYDFLPDAAIPEPTIHLDQPLFYRPATESERQITLAAIAYGRGNLERGRDSLKMALTLNPGLTANALVFEQSFQAFLEAGASRLVASDPISYLESVCINLPTATRSERVFSQRFVGRAYLELAYMYWVGGWRKQTRNSLLKAFWNDWQLLSNRGALRLLAETILGRLVVDKVRSIRLRWDDLS